MNEQQARQKLAEADRERAVASWADGLRCTIRLGRPVKVSEMHQRGPFGRKREYLYALDDRMPAAAVDGLYRALLVIQREAEAKADALAAEVTR
jgi:hypothetical protein